MASNNDNDIAASNKFDPGPAIEIRMCARRKRRMPPSCTGTGRAYPKTPSPEIDSSNGSTSVPKGSMWALGFKVTRPSDLA